MILLLVFCNSIRPTGAGAVSNATKSRVHKAFRPAVVSLTPVKTSFPSASIPFIVELFLTIVMPWSVKVMSLIIDAAIPGWGYCNLVNKTLTPYKVIDPSLGFVSKRNVKRTRFIFYMMHNIIIT